MCLCLCIIRLGRFLAGRLQYKHDMYLCLLVLVLLCFSLSGSGSSFTWCVFGVLVLGCNVFVLISKLDSEFSISLVLFLISKNSVIFNCVIGLIFNFFDCCWKVVSFVFLSVVVGHICADWWVSVFQVLIQQSFQL